MKTGLPKLTEAVRAKGFALIATITLMLLLALLSVGVLTLASVQTRVSKSGRYMSEARAQARLALEMAIGRLQCDLGPDQRISANSSIITDGNSVHKNILGVWNSWKTWLNATDPQGQKITNTYTTGRKSQFRSWLISSPLVSDSITLEALQTSGLGLERPEKVLLLGRGTLGQDYPSPADFVYATLIETPSMDVNAKKAPNRSYVAWWVTGENQKANLALPATPEAKDALSAQKYSATAPRPSASNLGLIPAIPNIQDDDLDREKSLTLGTLNLNGSGANTNGVPYFDVTTQSQSLLTDVRAGGLKKDLSLFLNMTQDDILNYENAQTTNSSTGSKKRYAQNTKSDAPLRPMDTSLVDNQPKVTIRPIGSWQQLHLWGNLWRKTPKTSGSGGSSSEPDSKFVQNTLDFSTGAPISFTAGTETYDPSISDSSSSGKSILDNKQSYMRHPVILAFYQLYGLRIVTWWTDYGATLCFVRGLANMPLMLWWNPYNIPLHVKANGWYAFTSPAKTIATQAINYLKDKTVNCPEHYFGRNYGMWSSTLFQNYMPSYGANHAEPVAYRATRYATIGQDYGTNFYNSDPPEGGIKLTLRKASDLVLQPGEFVWFCLATPNQNKSNVEMVTKEEAQSGKNYPTSWHNNCKTGEESGFIPFLTFEWKARLGFTGRNIDYTGRIELTDAIDTGLSVRLCYFGNEAASPDDTSLIGPMPPNPAGADGNAPGSKEDSFIGEWPGSKKNTFWGNSANGICKVRYDLQWGMNLGTSVFETGFGSTYDSPESKTLRTLTYNFHGSIQPECTDGEQEHNVKRLSLPNRLNIEWFTPQETLKYGKIITVNSNEGIFDPSTFTGPENLRICGASGIIVKNGADRADIMNKDFRTKSWLYSYPAFSASSLQNPTDAKRLYSSYQLDLIKENTELSSGFQVAGRNRRNGTLGIRDYADAEQVSSISSSEIPTTPPMSIAAFSGLRLTPGWFDPAQDTEVFGRTFTMQQNRRFSYQNGVHAVGIGNSYADPMINTSKVYNKIEDNPDFNADFWDHNFLINDALWDGYFCSSITDRPNSETDPTSIETAENVATNFFNASQFASRDNAKEQSTLPNYRLKATNDASTVKWEEEISKPETWARIAQYLILDGGFNVNSTSVPAWKAQLKGLKNRPLATRDYYQNKGKLSQVVNGGVDALFSRFNTAASTQPIDNTYDPLLGSSVEGGLSRWLDLRALSDTDLDALAEKIVFQVKARGPFLSMSEFVNRRLAPSTDEKSLKGALQAAIDETTINEVFETGFELNPTMAKNYSTVGGSPEAALGSRYTAAPGYLIQSDLLKALGNVLTVRDDTFKVRAFGCIKTANGKELLAQTWCEATVQRQLEYVDPTNPPNTPALVEDSSGIFESNSQLTTINKAFGRRMKIVEFRWLSEADI